MLKKIRRQKGKKRKRKGFYPSKMKKKDAATILATIFFGVLFLGAAIWEGPKKRNEEEEIPRVNTFL